MPTTTKKAAKKKVAKKKTALPKGKSRSAKTGKYVSKDFAAKHKNTTVTEKK